MKTFPLSESQLGIFYEWVKDPQVRDYNNPFLFKYSTRIDSDQLEAALNRVFSVHPIYFTRIVLENDQVCQYIDRERPIPIQRRRMTDAELDAYIPDFVQPFDLYKDVLCRIAIVQTERSVNLLLDVYHIITDGLSMDLFLKDLNTAYDGQPLAKEDLLYPDYIRMERESFQTEQYQAAGTCYRDKFKGVPMTKIYSQPTGGVGFLRQLSRYMSAKIVDTFCAEQGITTNFFFMAAYSWVLSLFSKEEKVAFYTVYHGRSDKRFMSSYGTFIKLTPMLAVVDPERQVIDFIHSLKEDRTNTVRYGIYPFTHFCRDLSLRPETSFVFQRGIGEKARLGEEESVWNFLPKGLTNQNLSVVIYYLDGQYEIRLEYNDSRNDPFTMEHFVRSIQVVAENMLSHPHALLKDISPLSEEETKEVLALSRGESILWPEETFLDAWKRQVALSGGKTAVVDHRGWLSYQALEEESDRVAASLIEKGVRSGDFVGVMLLREKTFMICVIGIMKAGAAYLPLDPTYPEERIRYMLEDSGAKYLISQPYSLAPATGEVAFPSIRSDQPAYMIYTSGSTGEPKGVVISHQALAAFIHTCVHQYELTAEDRIFCHSSFSFDASVEDLFPVLTCGGELHILPDDMVREPAQIAAYITQNRLTGGNFTTQFGVEMLRHYQLPLRYITVGGERLEEIPSTEARFFNSYGPTEFTVDATFFEPSKEGRDDCSIPIGRPTPNSYAYVLDENRHLVPPGCVGELYLSGPQIALGYWKREELTHERFVSNPYSHSVAPWERMYRTGDLVRWNARGELEYIGRIDHQIKLRGFRIEKGEIEYALSCCEGVTQSVVEMKDIHGENHLCAYYLSDRPIPEDDLRVMLEKRLASYMIPSSFQWMERFPLTPSGKIDRDALPAPSLVSKEAYAAPVTLEERVLANIVQAVLGQERVGVESDLFDLGLTSMQAMQIAFEAGSSGIHLSVSALYTYRTIRKSLQCQRQSYYYWGNECRPDKPVLVLVCGNSYFHPFYDAFARYFDQDFSFFVFESYHDYFLGQQDVRIDLLFDFYVRILRAALKEMPIFAMTGFCFGAELAMALAERLKREGICAPKVLMMDGYLDRRKDEPNIPMAGTELMREHDRISTLLGNTLPPMHYDGELLICLAKHKIERLVIESGEIKNERILAATNAGFQANKKRWKEAYPQTPYYELEADHDSCFETKALDELRAIMKRHWHIH